MVLSIIDGFREDLRVYLRVKSLRFVRVVPTRTDSVSHSEHGCDLDEVIHLVVDEVVLHHDGLVSAREVFLLGYFFDYLFFFAEFGYLGWLQSFAIRRFDLVDLCQFLVEVADLVKDYSVEGVAFPLLFGDGEVTGFFHSKGLDN